jgi:CubicO group peptidase (beta-lactamase class C family)
MYSTRDTEPLLEFYHTAKNINKTGVSNVTSDTGFRIGSVSKVFTVAALLLHEDKFKWNDPITKWIPQLNNYNHTSNPVHQIQWNEVTLEMLASQLGGIPRDSKCIESVSIFSRKPLANCCP